MRYILVLLLLCGCGTRKVENNKTDIKDDRITIENTYSEGEKIIMANNYTFRPIDNLKPFFVNGQEYENVAITMDKGITKEKYFNITKKIHITRTITIVKTKQTKKTDYTILYIGLFALLLIFIYFKTVF